MIGLNSPPGGRVRKWVHRRMVLPARISAPVGLLCAFFLVLTLSAWPQSTVDATGHILYVNDDAAGSRHDGRSWASAYRDLQAALAVAQPGTEIWVAAGTYKPTSDANRGASFHLRKGVALYGGFAGHETNRAGRDVISQATILSGDIGVAGNADDNSYHVVAGVGVDASAVLDGFTITGGNANGAGGLNLHGGGLLNAAGSPTVSNVNITENRAEAFGGGIFNEQGSNPNLVNVTITGNRAAYGGAMHNLASAPRLTNVVIAGNSAVMGGAVYNRRSNPIMVNATVAGNHADVGGGLFNYDHSSPRIANSIIWANQALSSRDATAQMTNGGNSNVRVEYAMVEGGCPSNSTCRRVFDTDPRFVRTPDPGDRTWQTLADNDYGDLRLQANSPAIDAGSNVSGVLPDLADLDADGNVREPTPVDRGGGSRFVESQAVGNTGRGVAPLIDLGAYEAPAPARVTLTVSAARHTVGELATVTTTVRNHAGTLMPGVPMQFVVNGVNTASGSGITDVEGHATFQYTGMVTGLDTVKVIAAGLEATDTVVWEPPTTTPAVRIVALGPGHGGAWLGLRVETGASGDVSGFVGYLDHSVTLVDTEIASVVADGASVTLYGTGELLPDGRVVRFWVDAVDRGSGWDDQLKLRLSTGYESRAFSGMVTLRE